MIGFILPLAAILRALVGAPRPAVAPRRSTPTPEPSVPVTVPLDANQLAATTPVCATCKRAGVDLWFTPHGRLCRFCMAIAGVEA